MLKYLINCQALERSIHVLFSRADNFLIQYEQGCSKSETPHPPGNCCTRGISAQQDLYSSLSQQLQDHTCLQRPEPPFLVTIVPCPPLAVQLTLRHRTWRQGATPGYLLFPMSDVDPQDNPDDKDKLTESTAGRCCKTINSVVQLNNRFKRK